MAGPMLCAQLSAVREELEAATVRARRLVADHDADALRRVPPIGGWSAVQCLEHLNITTEAYLPMLARCLRDAPPAAGRARFGVGLMPRLLIWSLEPPYRQKFKTLSSFEPAAGGDPKETLAAFERLQGELLKAVHDFDGKALDHMRLASPFNEHLKYNAYAAFRILATHERRHLWQAERALAGGR